MDEEELIEVLQEYFANLIKEKKSVISRVVNQFQKVYRAKDENLDYEKELNTKLAKLKNTRPYPADIGILVSAHSAPEGPPTFFAFNYGRKQILVALAFFIFLNERGLRTKRNCQWSQNAVCRILTNEIYTGKIIIPNFTRLEVFALSS